MGAEIVKIYRQEVPALRFIGKKYGESDRVDGMYSKYWKDWINSGWFSLLMRQTDTDLKTLYEDGDAPIGLMRWKEDEPFEYWIGLFMPEGTPAPEGFDFHDFSAASLGVCWIYGNENEVYMQEDNCWRRLITKGYEVIRNGDGGAEGAYWFFERYSMSRFTATDEKGKFILDSCWYVK